MMGAEMDYGILIQVVALVASAIGVYAAIRSDLKVLHVRQNNTEEDVKELRSDVKGILANGHCHHRSTDV